MTTPIPTPATDPSNRGDSAPTGPAAEALTSAGVAVVEAPAPVVTDAILTLTTAQAQFMVAEATSGSGLLGADLDAAGGGATSGLPVSAVLAGYVRGVDTNAAAYARTLLGQQDLTQPEHVVFPTIVLALFAADAASAFAADARAGETTAPPTSGAGFREGGFGASRRVRTGICSDVTKSIFDAVDKIFAKIHIPPGRVGDTGSSFLNGVLQGLTNVVVSGLNFVIDAAKTLIVDGIKFVLGQVLSIVAEVAAAAALVANIVSAIRPWKLDVTAKDPNTRKGVDAEKIYDQVTAKAIIIGPTDDWPAWFVDCAAVAGVTLPSLLPVDAPVTWKVFSYVPSAGLMTESTDEIPKDTALRKDGDSVIAKLGLITGTETKDQASTGAVQHGAVLVTATARRNQIEELRKTLVTAAKNLANQILQNVPGLIRDFLTGLVSQAAEGSSEQVASLLDASGTALIDVAYHGPPKPEVGSSTTEAWSFAVFDGGIAPSIAGYTCSGLVGTWHVIFGPGSELERTYDLAFSASAMTAHHDLIYDFPPAGTSPAVHVEWRLDYRLDTTVSPPMIRISGTQHETPAGGSESVFDTNFGTGDGITLENKSLPKLLQGSGLTHPFLDQAAADCG
ncbi:MAG: hypothetical protein JWN62_4074 [Acidimicrobiales bacterium]|nr:hypothetical protein [Acidimicrobiales bacterium]